MEIFIVRHGQTDWNKEKRLQGSADIRLNENGREVAIKTGIALSGTEIDIIYSSPLKRAYETACLIRNSRNIQIITDPRLKELNFGCMEGKCYDELVNDSTLGFRYFFDKPQLYFPSEGGETLTHLICRAGEFMREVIEPLENTRTRVMIVAHAAINKGIMSYIKKQPLEGFWSGGLQTNCNVIVVDYTGEKYKIVDETRVYYK